jgi:transcriptional regulator with XRE-family HTH domain
LRQRETTAGRRQQNSRVVHAAIVAVGAPKSRQIAEAAGLRRVSVQRHNLITENMTSIEQRIARRLARLRADRGWSLEQLAGRTAISRATLSRLERAELSPTAAMLGRLCRVYGWTLSRLMAEAETRTPHLVTAAAQMHWSDPETGYRRRIISPPAAGLRGELVEVRIPAGATVAFDAPPVSGLEHHLFMIDGALALEVDGSAFRLRAGDCVRYVLTGASRFTATGKRDARYIVAMVHP